MNEKLAEHFATGARLVWVVDPDEHSVTVYAEANEGRVLKEGRTLDGGVVLPGFAVPVAELFD